ncbi:MAG: hydroxyacid dehydrogenase [Ardenticatenaceae bacterium]|nr:hydroxyacid dehydrogenase [Ardenticatenaceae bacterium]
MTTSNRTPFTVFCTGASYYGSQSLVDLYPRVAEAAELRLIAAESEEELIAALTEADAVVVRSGHFTRPVFAALPRLRGVAKWGVGVESIDVPGATAEGVIIANSPGNSIAVAEASFLLLLAVSKNLLVLVDSIRRGDWQPRFSTRGHEIYGKILGIIGLGRIGRHLARLAQGAGMTVVAYDPYVDREKAAGLGVEMLSLPELLQTADAVSIHAVLTPETYHLIGEEELALMKPTAWLINTARGPIVDQAALINALRVGTIAGAGLDVFEHEPVAADNPLLSMPNVICTPHALPRTWESTKRTTTMLQDAILAILEGRLPETCLNPTVQPRHQQHIRGADR